jgi:uncharacterized membrane protein
MQAQPVRDADPPLPEHVQEAIASIAEMQAAHHREARLGERLTDTILGAVGRPEAFVVVALIALLWILAGARVLIWPDRAPYPLLSLLLALLSISLSILILAGQRRADRLHQRRQQMALQVALLAEHKASKIIDLIEELRRDMPDVHNRFDREAAEMAVKPDHGTVLEIIEEKTAPDGDAETKT